MSSASRIPLAATSTNARESVLLRTAAQKIKRKSIGLPSAVAAAKRARQLAPRPTTPPTTASARPSTGAPPATTSRVLHRPMSSTMMTGRATIGTAPRSGIRPPLPAASRQRASSTSIVDAEKEEMRKKLSEMEEKLSEKEEKLSEKEEKLSEMTKKEEEQRNEIIELKAEKNELKTEKTDLKEELLGKKMEVDEQKCAIKELKLDLKTSKDDRKTEKEEHARVIQEKEDYIGRLRREAIDKDEQLRCLHNDVVDLRGRIRVSVRVRPLLGAEQCESTAHLSYPDQSTIGIEQQPGKVLPFSFNNVYGPNYTQLRIFDGVKELIMSVMHGFNVSLISYGQTGSGKTHTMRGGKDEAAGLIPRSVRYLFENRSRLEDLDWSFEFAASFLEVYNNECYDLLSTPPRAKREIKQIHNKFVVDGLTVEPIDDIHKMTSLLRQSDANRSTASTKCNETSSRSHAIFALSVKGRNGTTGAQIESVLKLVDLAGSERAKESGAVGDRFVEMTHINTALSNLQTCIRNILTKQPHVPYRNSKLTTLLQDSLEGGSKCMVILSLSPQETMMSETKRTLEFGRNLSQTHIGVAKKKET